MTSESRARTQEEKRKEIEVVVRRTSIYDTLAVKTIAGETQQLLCTLLIFLKNSRRLGGGGRFPVDVQHGLALVHQKPLKAFCTGSFSNAPNTTIRSSFDGPASKTFTDYTTVHYPEGWNKPIHTYKVEVPGWLLFDCVLCF